MSDEYELYPRGAIAMGNGELVQVTNVKVSYTNAAKNIPTIRSAFSGFVVGEASLTGSLDTVVPASGEERDYWAMVEKGTVKQVRLKLPGKTKAFNIVFDKVDIELPVGAPIAMNLTFIGAPADT